MRFVIGFIFGAILMALWFLAEDPEEQVKENVEKVIDKLESCFVDGCECRVIAKELRKTLDGEK